MDGELHLATPADIAFMEQAVVLGRLGWGAVHPNPMVGCVLVQDDVVVGQGWHGQVGGPHAEIWALRDAGPGARGSTAYVSLEPCSHHGRTPPCTDALLEAGVARVVYGAPDPGRDSGGGGSFLARRGLAVMGPLLDLDRSRAENPMFFLWAQERRPFVAVKLAQTLDGKIARPGEATRITGPEAEQHVHELRRGFDAIMVGSATARIDDPRLTVRHGTAPVHPPARVVVDSDCTLAPRARLFDAPLAAPVHVFIDSEVETERSAPLVSVGATVHRVPRSERGLDLSEVFVVLDALGFRSVLCEGGGRLANSVLESGLAERLYLYVAPWIMGPDGVDGLKGPSGPDAWTGWRSLESGGGVPHVPLGGAGVGSDGLLVYRRTY